MPTGQVFVTESSRDGLAPTGLATALEHRIDPSSPAFGAHDFSSDGSGALRAVTNHGPIDGNSATRASYWDPYTEAITDTAKVTLGQGASIPVGGTPLDRLETQADAFAHHLTGVQ